MDEQHTPQIHLDGQSFRRVLILGVIALAVGFVVLLAAVATPWEPVRRIDLRVADWGYRETYGRAGLTAWWVDVARYGAPIFQRGVMLLLAIVLLRQRHRAAAIWLICLVVAENLVAPGVKHLLSRPRPHWNNPIAVEHSTSFPSGHATAAATFAVAVLLLAPIITTSRPGRHALEGITVVAAVVICADRIFLGVHYLTDVVGGILLGGWLALSAWWLLAAMTDRRSGATASEAPSTGHI